MEGRPVRAFFDLLAQLLRALASLFTRPRQATYPLTDGRRPFEADERTHTLLEWRDES